MGRSPATGAAPAAAELLEELRRLVARFPIPHPSWHGYVPEMRTVVRDLAAAIDALQSLPRAQAELLRRVEGRPEPQPEQPAGVALADAQERLRALPVPAGEHPFLDEIAVTIEAAEAALTALAASPDGERAFAAALGSRPAEGTRENRQSPAPL